MRIVLEPQYNPSVERFTAFHKAMTEYFETDLFPKLRKALWSASIEADAAASAVVADRSAAPVQDEAPRRERGRPSNAERAARAAAASTPAAEIETAGAADMNDAIRQRLCDLVAEHGRSVVRDPRRFEALLRDFCGPDGKESKILLLTLKEQVPHDLLARSLAVPWPTRLGRLSQKLQQGFAMEAGAAVWAVESWAIALGMISGSNTGKPGARRRGGSAEMMAGRVAGMPVSAVPPLFVSKLGPEHCHSIGEAIQAARPGSRILVFPGVYNEEIVLDKPVEIVGEGSLADIIVQNTSGSCCLTMRTDYAVVRNVTLRGRAALAGKSVVTVFIPQGRLVLEDCDVSSDSGAAIFVHGALAQPLIRFCDIHDSAGGSGVCCDERSEGSVEDCDIYGNALAQIAVVGGSTCVFRRCHVRHGKEGGVWLGERGQGILEDCLIWANAGEGMDIEGESNPTVSRCSIQSNGQSGVVIRGKSKGIVEGCQIHSNGEGQAQVAIQEKSGPILKDCRISDSRGVGVSVQGNAKGLLEDCEVANSAGVGVYIDGGSDPTLRRCLVRDGRRNGVVITGGSKGALVKCEVVRHLQRYPAIAVTDKSSPLLSGCTVHGAASTGVLVTGESSGMLEDCEIYETMSAGVEIAGESSPSVKNCVVRNGQETGVLVRGKSQGVLERCQIRDNARAGVTVQEGGNPVLKGCEIEGNDCEAVRICAHSGATVVECDLSGNERGPWDIAAGCLVRRTGNRVEGREFLDVVCWECHEAFETEQAGFVACPNSGCRAHFEVDGDGHVVQGGKQVEEEPEEGLDDLEVEDDDDDYFAEPVVITCEQCGDDFEIEEVGSARCPSDECQASYEWDGEGWIRGNSRFPSSQ